MKSKRIKCLFPLRRNTPALKRIGREEFLLKLGFKILSTSKDGKLYTVYLPTGWKVKHNYNSNALLDQKGRIRAFYWVGETTVTNELGCPIPEFSMYEARFIERYTVEWRKGQYFVLDSLDWNKILFTANPDITPKEARQECKQFLEEHFPLLGTCTEYWDN